MIIFNNVLGLKMFQKKIFGGEDMFLKWIISTVAALNSNKKVGELAAGVSFAFMLALIPSGNLLWPVLLFITMFLKVHQGMEFIWLAIFKLIVPIFDPLLNPIGYAILTFNPLRPLFIKLNNIPLMPFTDFNNTLVIGGFVIGILLFVPLFIIFKVLVEKYRDKYKEKVENSAFFKWFKKLPLIKTLFMLSEKAVAVYGKVS